VITQDVCVPTTDLDLVDGPGDQWGGIATSPIPGYLVTGPVVYRDAVLSGCGLITSRTSRCYPS